MRTILEGRGILRVLAIALFVLAAPGRAALAKTCAELNRTSIPASEIGLPSSGADVTTTTVAATATMGEYCKATVAIHPVDKTAPDIIAMVNLTAGWNCKAFM